MCIGNRASSAAYYINQQLETLWTLSNQCVEKHGHGIKASKSEVEYGSCLAQVCVGKHSRSKPSQEDLDFFASFGAAPQLEFICNHEAILRFQLKSGHYRIAGKSNIELFEEYTCAFRLQFREHLITDTSYFTFGQTDTCKAKLLILDLNTATFLRESSGFPQGNKLGFEVIDCHHRSITQYLSKYYLPLLRKAGIHCLHSLPDFNNLSRTHHIDYSIVSETDIEVVDIFGINIEAINTFMATRWLEAASYVDELEEDHDHSSYGQYAIAEHRGVCDDIAFHAFFGAPRLRAMCSKEVIMYIDVQDLHFYMEGSFDREVNYKVSDWTIAIAVEVNLAEEKGDRNLKLDFTKARFCEKRSSCHSETIEQTILLKLRTIFVNYIIQRYLFILEEFQHNHVYRIDVRVVEVEEEEDIEEEEYIDISTEFRERVSITDTFGFDLVTAITQGSINNHLRCLWKASQSGSSCITSWAFEEFFSSTFGALQIQFPCDSRSNTVTVYVTLREGFLTNLGRGRKCVGGEKHEFSNWRLAFDVTLRAIDYTKPHTTSDVCLRDYHGVDDYTLKQLVLDFSTAKFRQDLSRLSGLFEGSNYRQIRSKREALLYYITQYYFAELQEEGHNVLYSIPIWKQGGSKSIRYAASSFSFQFYGFPTGQGEQYASGLFGGQGSQGDRNMLVICGTMDQGRRPSFPLPRCPWNLSTDREAFSGGFVLSRAVFLEGWLLPELARINGRTTLVPKFHGIGDKGDWRMELIRWIDHPPNKDKECGWRAIAQSEEGLEFEWKNSDEWTYAHYGDTCDVYNGGYTFSCVTTNNVTVPTVARHGVCEIKVGGNIDLKLGFSGAEKSWSTNATYRWSSTITISSDKVNGGLKIESTWSRNIPEPSGFEGHFDIVNPNFKDASTLLKEQLSEVVLVEETTLNELNTVFAGVWPLFFSGFYGYKLTNPIFNSNGDLRFDLLCPIDRQGGIVGEHRADICLPTGVKTRGSEGFRRKIDLRGTSLPTLGIRMSPTIVPLESSFGETSFGESVLFTSSTGIDTPLRTPPLDRFFSQSSDRNVRVRGEENGYIGEDAGVIRGHETPKGQRSIKVSDLQYVEGKGTTTVRRGY